MALPLSAYVVNEVYYHIVVRDRPNRYLLSSQVCQHGKVNLIFCGNFLTEKPCRIIQYNIYIHGVCSLLIWRARPAFAF